MSSTPFYCTLSCLVLSAFQTLADTHYVSVNSTNPVPPYTNWATAANEIQDAVDESADGDTVLVAKGVYSTGGRAVHGAMTNRVTVDRALILQSLMGADETIIVGYQVPGTTNGNGAVRCVYLTNNASLIGFTLTNGAVTGEWPNTAELGGGGLYCFSTNEWASNCVLTGNSGVFGGGACLGTLNDCVLTGNSSTYGGGACWTTLNDCDVTGNSATEGGGSYVSMMNRCALTDNTADWAGGAYFSTLNDCTLTGNSGTHGGGSYEGTLNNCIFSGNSAYEGGGSKSGTLNNCTVVGNSAEAYGGGAYGGKLNNCIVYFNKASFSGDNNDGAFLKYCCVTPVYSFGGIGNFTNAPLFADTNSWTNLRLQSNSPCINAGNNSYETGTNDLDGNQRITGGTVDVGAYEFQNPQSSISYAYLQSYGLPTDGSVDNLDGDGDGATTWQEWKMWTIPIDEASVLRMLLPALQTNGLLVAWQSVSNQTYALERATNGSMVFGLLQSGIASQGQKTTFTDMAATNGGAFLYRVSVRE